MSANEFWTNSDGLNVRFGLEKATAHAEDGHVTNWTCSEPCRISIKILTDKIFRSLKC